jgi:hypothetical protein
VACERSIARCVDLVDVSVVWETPGPYSCSLEYPALTQADVGPINPLEARGQYLIVNAGMKMYWFDHLQETSSRAIVIAFWRIIPSDSVSEMLPINSPEHEDWVALQTLSDQYDAVVGPHVNFTL